jgi:hypothetical protein
MRRQSFKGTIDEIELTRSIVETGKLISVDNFIESRKDKYVFLDSKRISNSYKKIDFIEMFGKDQVKHHSSYSTSVNRNYYGILLDCIEYFTIKDDIVGSFRIEDFGENYLIPRSHIEKIENDLIDYFKSFGYNCEKLNDNYINIRKERVE